MNCQQLPLLIQSTMNSLVLIHKEDELSTVATVDSKYYEFISGQGR